MKVTLCMKVTKETKFDAFVLGASTNARTGA